MKKGEPNDIELAKAKEEAAKLQIKQLQKQVAELEEKLKDSHNAVAERDELRVKLNERKSNSFKRPKVGRSYSQTDSIREKMREAVYLTQSNIYEMSPLVHTPDSVEVLLGRNSIRNRRVRVRFFVKPQYRSSVGHSDNISHKHVDVEFAKACEEVKFNEKSEILFKNAILTQDMEWTREWSVVIYEDLHRNQIYWTLPCYDPNEEGILDRLDDARLLEILRRMSSFTDPFQNMLFHSPACEMVTKNPERLRSGLIQLMEAVEPSEHCSKYNTEFMACLSALEIFSDYKYSPADYPFLSRYGRSFLKTHDKLSSMFREGINIEDIVKSADFKKVLKFSFPGQGCDFLENAAKGMVDKLYPNLAQNDANRSELIMVFAHELSLLLNMSLPSQAVRPKKGVMNLLWLDNLALEGGEIDLTRRTIGLAYLAGEEYAQVRMKREAGIEVSQGRAFKEQRESQKGSRKFTHTEFVHYWIMEFHKEYGKWPTHKPFKEYMTRKYGEGECPDYETYRHKIEDRHVVGRLVRAAKGQKNTR
ncbi:hypothetical protein Rhal01_03667 [Rubritalea halochordaticola]|uniref:Uncharacterized protein n=1 Tax=Rubritalea halochordaticola TaxID=714537 RepID=A0ABP9V489_9BACT